MIKEFAKNLQDYEKKTKLKFCMNYNESQQKKFFVMNEIIIIGENFLIILQFCGPDAESCYFGLENKREGVNFAKMIKHLACIDKRELGG